jgi:hypothetical protein
MFLSSYIVKRMFCYRLLGVPLRVGLLRAPGPFGSASPPAYPSRFKSKVKSMKYEVKSMKYEVKSMKYEVKSMKWDGVRSGIMSLLPMGSLSSVSYFLLLTSYLLNKLFQSFFRNTVDSFWPSLYILSHATAGCFNGTSRQLKATG